MEESTQQMTVTELTETIMPLLESKGYNSMYVHAMHCIFNQLLKFCNSDGISRFSAELGQRFLEQHYGIERGIKSRTQSKAHRAMDMLSAYQQFGAIMLRRRKNREFPYQFVQQANDYFEGMRRAFASDNTIKTHRTMLHRLTEFLDGQGIRSVNDITADSLTSYIKMVLCNYSKDIVRHELSVMRYFMKFLHARGDLPVDLSTSLPRLHISSTPSHLPSTFATSEVARLLASVDRSSPAGKRDYAVLILAAKLGLRTSDIKTLK